MNMKLSYRDKVIFIVVIVILILVAGFFLMIKPKFEEIDRARMNLESVQNRKADIDARIATLPDVIENMKTVAKDIGEKQGIFMTEQDPYLNEMYLRDAFSSFNLDYDSFSTNYTTSAAINKYTVSPAHILAYENKMNADLYNELPQEVYDVYNKVKAPSYPNATIGRTTVVITFETDAALRSLYNVIDRIADDEKTVYLNSVMLDNNSDVPQKSVSCSLTLYSINPLNVEKVLEETDDITPVDTSAEDAG